MNRPRSHGPTGNLSSSCFCRPPQHKLNDNNNNNNRVCRSEHITPVHEDLHWLPVSQKVVFKTALMVWKCFSWYRSSLSRWSLHTRYWHLQSSAFAICSDCHSTGSTRPDCNWTTKFRSQRTIHMEPSATSTMVTGPVGERLQAALKTHPFLPPVATETSSWFWRRI